MSDLSAFLHFGWASKGGPCLTVEVPVKATELPASGQTVTGYGARIPTEHMVKWEGRWRRVYVANWGNSGTAYIGPSDEWLARAQITTGFTL